MEIIALILLEMMSIAGALVIKMHAYSDAVINVGENGYKINRNLIEKYIETKLEKTSSFKKVMESIVMLLPVVNLIAAAYENNRLSFDVMNNSGLKQYMIPLTDLEKKELDSMQKPMIYKYDYIAYDDDDIYIKKTNGKVFCNLKSGMLSRKMTLDDLRLLAIEFKLPYKLCKVNGEVIAILGLNEAALIDCVTFDKKGQFELEDIDKSDKVEEIEDISVYVLNDTIRNSRRFNMVCQYNFLEVVNEVITDEAVFQDLPVVQEDFVMPKNVEMVLKKDLHK